MDRPPPGDANFGHPAQPRRGSSAMVQWTRGIGSADLSFLAQGRRRPVRGGDVPRGEHLPPGYSTAGGASTAGWGGPTPGDSRNSRTRTARSGRCWRIRCSGTGCWGRRCEKSGERHGGGEAGHAAEPGASRGHCRQRCPRGSVYNPSPMELVPDTSRRRSENNGLAQTGPPVLDGGPAVPGAPDAMSESMNLSAISGAIGSVRCSGFRLVRSLNRRDHAEREVAGPCVRLTRKPPRQGHPCAGRSNPMECPRWPVRTRRGTAGEGGRPSFRPAMASDLEMRMLA